MPPLHIRIRFPVGYSVQFHFCQSLNFTTLKELFILQCGGIDPRRDTFSRVIAQAGEAGGDPSPRLKPREMASLHGIYLQALSDALRREARARMVPRELLRVHGDALAG
ncbi:MAG: hypothetical protein JWM59_3298 [Verrucomicrobiales bacterium]|nr:hypothetical protein [Verrucomicrobiales bacterium]